MKTFNGLQKTLKTKKHLKEKARESFKCAYEKVTIRFRADETIVFEYKGDMIIRFAKDEWFDHIENAAAFRKLVEVRLYAAIDAKEKELLKEKSSFKDLVISDYRLSSNAKKPKDTCLNKMLKIDGFKDFEDYTSLFDACFNDVRKSIDKFKKKGGGLFWIMDDLNHMLTFFRFVSSQHNIALNLGALERLKKDLKQINDDARGDLSKFEWFNLSLVDFFENMKIAYERFDTLYVDLRDGYERVPFNDLRKKYNEFVGFGSIFYLYVSAKRISEVEGAKFDDFDMNACAYRLPKDNKTKFDNALTMGYFIKMIVEKVKEIKTKLNDCYEALNIDMNKVFAYSLSDRPSSFELRFNKYKSELISLKDKFERDTSRRPQHIVRTYWNTLLMEFGENLIIAKETILSHKIKTEEVTTYNRGNNVSLYLEGSLEAHFAMDVLLMDYLDDRIEREKFISLRDGLQNHYGALNTSRKRKKIIDDTLTALCDIESQTRLKNDTNLNIGLKMNGDGDCAFMKYRAKLSVPYAPTESMNIDFSDFD